MHTTGHRPLLASVLLAALFATSPRLALASGACCIEAEEDCRQVTNPLPCASIGGVYVEGGSCAAGVCYPGACCDGPSCAVVTGIVCLAGGSDFLGGGTTCNDNPCGVEAVGGCCTGEACTEVTQAVCAVSGGNWLGEGVSCAIAPCSPGACCAPGGACSDTLPLACQQAGGAFLPAATCAGEACGVGACCDGLSCSSSNAYDCAAAGRQFGGAGTTCLDDPCGAGIGACCLAGGCSDASPEDCALGGGVWLGAGTNCEQGQCVIGACCRPGECDDLARFVCSSIDGVFFAGSNCAAEDACAATFDCDGDSLFAQSPNLGGVAGVSDQFDSTFRWDNYEQVLGAVETVRFWGLDLRRSGGSFVECVDQNPTFRIEFYDDQLGQPGGVVCGYTLVASRTPTGHFIQDFAEVNEYEVELPFFCVQPNGWISIVGLGDPDCIFLWTSSGAGDGGAYCVGCGFPPDDGYDLAFCLGGERGGVFGACCDEGVAVCQDNVEIDQCAGIGMRFYQDFTCEQIGPCEIVTGACCHDDDTACAVVTQAECAGSGGHWLGQFSDCFECPAVGACCIQDEICVVTTSDLCDTEYGTWIGDGTTCGDCPAIPPHCPEGSLLSYQADPPHGFVATTSEFVPGFSIANYFEGADGAITGLSWFGFDLDHRPDLGGFIECTEFDNTFDITFHADAAGVPGAVACEYTILADRVETGIVSYRGAMLNEYSVALPTSCIVTNGWVRIVGRGSADCWFLWLSGDSPAPAHCTGCGTTLIGGRNMCLAGDTGGVFGACCEDASGSCTENVEISDCAAVGQRFLANGLCADLAVPCGEFIGACCFSDATCSVGSEADCTTAGGSWLGADSLCSECPCLVPCPAGSVSEGEPVCAMGYVDESNGGCFATTPAFSPITPGVTVCGTGGVWEGTGGFLADWDVYEFALDHPAELTFTVLAEYAVIAAIYDGTGGCPGELLSAFGDFACDSANASATVGPGTYWLVTRVLSASDESQCGKRYTALLTVQPVSLGDGDGDGDVDLEDHAIFVNCMNGPAAEPAPTAPRTAQECLDAFDADFDADVDCEDAAAFQRAFEG